MTVTCPRCNAESEIPAGVKPADALCSKCYGSLDEQQAAFIAQADAEAKKLSDSFKR